MRKLVTGYKNLIYKNCLGREGYQEQNLDYWRNNLFAGLVASLIPLSTIALIPGIIYSITIELYWLAFYDTLTFLILLYIGMGPGVSILGRKIFFILCIYFVAFFLLIYIGIQGPGLIYLFASTLFAILIFPNRYAYWWSFFNVLICALFLLVIQFDLSPMNEVNNIEGDQWIAICVNVIFLSFLLSALLPQLFAGLSVTLSEQKRLQQKLRIEQQNLENTLTALEQKNNDLEQFAYLASHDLQEPLRMVKSFLTQLERKYKEVLDDKARQYIHFARDGATRMGAMINDLLYFSRVGRHEEQLEYIALSDIVEEVIGVQQKRIKEAKALINYRELPVIPSYRTPLIQIFQNLISNALKYRNETGPPEININVEDQENGWKISISDNGIGIAKEHFDKIFTIFQRLHGRTEYSGTGIGLAIVKKNIESLGGRIWVESEPGKGSTFYFILLKQSS